MQVSLTTSSHANCIQSSCPAKTDLSRALTSANPIQEKVPTDGVLARTEPAKPLIGKHVPAQKGLRVSMRPGYRDEGIGTVIDVHPTGGAIHPVHVSDIDFRIEPVASHVVAGHCSVVWDHGREDRCTFDFHFHLFSGNRANLTCRH